MWTVLAGKLFLEPNCHFLWRASAASDFASQFPLVNAHTIEYDQPIAHGNAVTGNGCNPLDLFLTATGPDNYEVAAFHWIVVSHMRDKAIILLN